MTESSVPAEESHLEVIEHSYLLTVVDPDNVPLREAVVEYAIYHDFIKVAASLDTTAADGTFMVETKFPPFCTNERPMSFYSKLAVIVSKAGYKTTSGYMDNSYSGAHIPIAPSPQATGYLTLPLSRTYSRYVSAENGLNIRNGPGTQYAIVTSVPCGRQLYMIEEVENWTHVSFSSSNRDSLAWASSIYLDKYWPDCPKKPVRSESQFYSGKKSYYGLSYSEKKKVFCDVVAAGTRLLTMSDSEISDFYDSVARRNNLASQIVVDQVMDEGNRNGWKCY